MKLTHIPSWKAAASWAVAVFVLGQGFSPAAVAQQPVTLLDNNAAPKTAPAPQAAVQAPQTPAVASRTAAATIVSRYGNIVGIRPVGAGGLTAWTVEKNGRKVVLYTTADVQVLFTGIVWDAASGRNLSDQFIPTAATSPAPVATPQAGVAAASPPAQINSALTTATVGAMDGKFAGPIPEAIKTVDSLAGFKEGQGGISDTVYIIVDPRCPYCRKAYNLTREFVKKGRTIKWIPVVALGDPKNGIPLVSTLLQSKDKDVLARVLGKHDLITTVPTKETTAAMEKSLAFMFAAFEQNGVQQAGVPVAFFLDHRTGQPRMMTGVSEMVVLQDIFGKL